MLVALKCVKMLKRCQAGLLIKWKTPFMRAYNH